MVLLPPPQQRQARKRLSYSIVTVDEIRELIQLATETGVAEVEVQRGENRVRIRRTFGEIVHEVSLPNQQPATKASGATASASATKAAQPEDSTSGKTLITVKSPIVGTFYESASPGSPPFVRV